MYKLGYGQVKGPVKHHELNEGSKEIGSSSRHSLLGLLQPFEYSADLIQFDNLRCVARNYFNQKGGKGSG